MTEVVALPAFEDNYIWVLRKDGCAAVVDPGDAAPVLEYLQREGLRLAAILATHHHGDHVGGNEDLLRRHPAPVYGPRDARIPTVDHPLADGDGVQLPELGLEYRVLEVPGHTRSHIAYVGAGTLYCGDTLFACGCGRLFEGTPAQMHASLRRLSALPPGTRVHCAHEYTLANIRFARVVDPDNEALRAREAAARALRAAGRPTVPSTIGEELATNPFLRCNVPAVRAAAEAHAGTPLRDEISVFAALRDWKNGFR
jgi:hydroxyacylglutathione hydrolase